MGGLGNQMFQIAVAYAMARRNNDECAFNFSESGYFRNILSQFSQLPERWTPELEYFEIGFDYNVIPYHSNMRLNGYFQSEKYFSDYRDDIIRMFSNQSIVETLRDLYPWENSVSIHVRHEDFLQFNTMEELPSVGYYQRAVDIIDGKTQVDHIFVFSDDMKWCKENLKDRRVVLVRWYVDFVDMYLMSLCRHNIIADSTFSWWGSYLNVNKDKIVIAPEKWNKNGNTDIYSDNMIVIPK
jgi:hypothetical protein